MYIVVDYNEYEEAEFLAPTVMYRELERCLTTWNNERFLLTNDFRIQYRVLFWNLIIYFKITKLPTFLLDSKLHLDEQKLNESI